MIPKSITIGGEKSADSLVKKLEKENKVSKWAKYILRRIHLAKRKEKIEIEVVSVSELGFTTLTHRDEVYKKAQELGYGILPAEAGAALRLAYKDQPVGELLVIGMEPIADSDGDLRVFYVGRDEDGRWLARCGYPDDMWFPAYRWVFARRKYLSSDAKTLGSSLPLEPLELPKELVINGVKYIKQ